MPFAKYKTVQVLGFEGTGKNIKEATDNVKAKITSLATGSWEPTIITWRGETVMIYRTLDGYVSRFIQHGGEEPKISMGSTHYGTDLREAIRSVQGHVMQMAWKFADPIDLFPEWCTDPEVRKEAIFWREWQLRYRDLRNAGHSADEAHRLASNPSVHSAA